jgi:hypothetical protein
MRLIWSKSLAATVNSPGDGRITGNLSGVCKKAVRKIQEKKNRSRAKAESASGKRERYDPAAERGRK